MFHHSPPPSLLVAVVPSPSHVQPLVTPWSVAPDPFCPWDFPGGIFRGKTTGVGGHLLFQVIFPTHVS